MIKKIIKWFKIKILKRSYKKVSLYEMTDYISKVNELTKSNGEEIAKGIHECYKDLIKNKKEVFTIKKI